MGSEDALALEYGQRLLALCRGFLLTREYAPERAAVFCRGFLLEVYNEGRFPAS